MIIESAVVSALLPGVVEAVKGAFGAITRKWIGLSVEDQIKLDDAQIRKMEALAKLDNPGGTPSQWVVNTRASFRYIAAGASIATGCALFFVAPSLGEVAAQLITIPFSFIFGERMVLSLKSNK